MCEALVSPPTLWLCGCRLLIATHASCLPPTHRSHEILPEPHGLQSGLRCGSDVRNQNGSRTHLHHARPQDERKRTPTTPHPSLRHSPSSRRRGRRRSSSALWEATSCSAPKQTRGIEQTRESDRSSMYVCVHGEPQEGTWERRKRRRSRTPSVIPEV